MPTMKAVDIKDGKGPKENLYITDVEKPEPKEGQVLVKVKAFGLNRMDILQREGKYPLPPQAGPILGVEFAGDILDLHSSVSSFKKGDKVFGLAYGGAYAEYIAVSAKMIMHIPDELDYTKAAGIPEVWFTATQALHMVGEVKKGDVVLIHAGASGVGLAAIQLAKAAGASKVFATAGTDDKCRLVEKLGATRGINYKTDDFAEVVLEETKDSQTPGANFILEFIGKDYWAKNMKAAARDAQIVFLAFMSGNIIPDADIGPILYKRLNIRGSTLRSRDAEYQGKLRDRVWEFAVPKIKTGEFDVVIDKVFGWEDVQEAHHRMESNSSGGGKIICTIDA